MKKLLSTFKPLLLLIVFFISNCSNNSSDKSDTIKDEAIKKIVYYEEHPSDWMEIVKKEINAKRKPVLFFTATWCGPCQEFKHSLGDPLMIDALKDITLIIIDVDIDADKEKISEKYEVGSYPTFIRVDEKGEVIKQTDGGAWQENIPQNMAPVLKSFMN